MRTLLTCSTCQFIGAVNGAALDTTIPVRCPDCGALTRSRRVTGKPGVGRCNADCMYAKGPDCECQCAGANHGAGHLIALDLGGPVAAAVKLQPSLF